MKGDALAHSTHRAYRPAAAAAAILLVSSIACLPPEKFPEGRQILQTRDARGLPGIWTGNAGLEIAVEMPHAPSPRDLRLASVNVIGGENLTPRPLIARWLPHDSLLRIADLVFTTDDPVGVAPDGAGESAPDLVITQFQTGTALARRSGFADLQVLGKRYAIFSRDDPPGDEFPRVEIGDTDGVIQDTGKVRLWTWVGDGMAFYVRGSDNSFLRLRGPNDTPELLLNEVAAFAVTSDARWALVDFLRDMNADMSIVDLQTLQRRVVPGIASDCRITVRHPLLPLIICMGNGDGDVAAPSPQPVRIVDLDRATIRETSASVHGLLRFHRFSSDGRRLVTGDASGVQMFNLDSGIANRWSGAGLLPVFTPDERFLVIKAAFADPLDSSRVLSRLVVFDGDLNFLGYASPPNHSVGSFGFIAGPGPGTYRVVCDANLFGQPAELLVTSVPPNGDPPLVLAAGVRKLALGEDRVLALVDVSQDRTGQLRLFHPATDESQVLATSVLDFGVAGLACANCPGLGAGTQVVFVVRGRVPRRADGVWVTELP